jgi:hypothetical protein
MWWVLAGLVALGLRGRRRDECALAPAYWNADGLDGETVQQIGFSADGRGEMSYAFNYIVHTDVRFRYSVDGDYVNFRYTRGTRERERRVRWRAEERGATCVLRFDESPFPRDVESADVDSYSRARRGGR